VGLLLIVAVFAGLYYVMKQVAYPNKQVNQVMVPSLIGETPLGARELLGEKLKLGSQTPREDDGPAAPGTIVEQSPSAGKLVDVGTPVDVVVKQGKTAVEVPDATGMQVNAAERVLSAAKLAASGELKHEFSDKVPKGIVMAQSPVPGTQMAAGSTVELTVSDGPKPEELPSTPGETPVEPGTGPATPGKGNVEPGADESAPVAPTVEMTPAPPDPASPDVKKVHVRITMQGKKLGQEIKVVLSDAQHPEDVIVREKRNPGDVLEQDITGQGDTTIKVFVDGRQVDTRNF